MGARAEAAARCTNGWRSGQEMQWNEWIGSTLQKQRGERNEKVASAESKVEQRSTDVCMSEQ